MSRMTCVASSAAGVVMPAAAGAIAPSRQRIHPAYAAMLTVSEATGWPGCFRDDLVKHDREILSNRDAPREFIWHLRPTGTNLCDLRRPNDWHYAALIAAWADYHHGKDHLWFHANHQGQLAPIEVGEVTRVFDRAWSSASIRARDVAADAVIEIHGRIALVESVTHGHRDVSIRGRFMQEVGRRDQGGGQNLGILAHDAPLTIRRP